MNVVDTCTGSATPLVSGSMAPSACAAMVRGFGECGSVMRVSGTDHSRHKVRCKTAPCKTGCAARYAQTGPRSGPVNVELPLLLRRAARDWRGRDRVVLRTRQHDARRL